jgi:hypothetical protein
MPKRFYRGYEDNGRVWLHDGDCNPSGTNDLCPSGMTCVEDYWDPDIFFCVDSCTGNSGCITNCCVETTDDPPQQFCAPYYRYCS